MIRVFAASIVSSLSGSKLACSAITPTISPLLGLLIGRPQLLRV